MSAVSVVDLLSVVVLVEDETPSLPELHEDVRSALDTTDCEFIYLVRTSAPVALAGALELHKADPVGVRVLRFGGPVGAASMLKAGLECARGELLLTLPGEYEANLAALPEMRRAIADGADLVIASRSAWKDAAPRLQSRVFSRLLSRAAGGAFGDATSRTRLLRKAIVSDLRIYGEFHRYMAMLALQAGFRVTEIPVLQHGRARLATAHAPSAYLWRALDLLSLFFLSRFTRHPLRLFGGVGGVLGLSGLAVLGVAAFQRLFLGVPLADRPVLVLGTLLLGLGVQVFTIGLLGELILFVHGRAAREYRVAEVLEAADPPLPPERETAP